jgi:hypothetical protein
MHFRSNHRRDLSSPFRHHITLFTILGVMSTIQNVSSRLSILFGQYNMKHIRQHYKHNIVDASTHSLLYICHTATYKYKYPTM